MANYEFFPRLQFLNAQYKYTYKYNYGLAGYTRQTQKLNLLKILKTQSFNYAFKTCPTVSNVLLYATHLCFLK